MTDHDHGESHDWRSDLARWRSGAHLQPVEGDKPRYRFHGPDGALLIEMTEPAGFDGGMLLPVGSTLTLPDGRRYELAINTKKPGDTWGIFAGLKAPDRGAGEHKNTGGASGRGATSSRPHALEAPPASQPDAAEVMRLADAYAKTFAWYPNATPRMDETRAALSSAVEAMGRDGTEAHRGWLASRQETVQVRNQLAAAEAARDALQARLAELQRVRSAEQSIAESANRSWQECIDDLAEEEGARKAAETALAAATALLERAQDWPPGKLADDIKAFLAARADEHEQGGERTQPIADSGDLPKAGASALPAGPESACVSPPTSTVSAPNAGADIAGRAAAIERECSAYQWTAEKAIAVAEDRSYAGSWRAAFATLARLLATPAPVGGDADPLAIEELFKRYDQARDDCWWEALPDLKAQIIACARAALRSAPPAPAAAVPVSEENDPDFKEPTGNVWRCKVGPFTGALPSGSDLPMRQAIQEAYRALTGDWPLVTFSGWGGAYTKGEREIVEDEMRKHSAPSGGDRG